FFIDLPNYSIIYKILFLHLYLKQLIKFFALYFILCYFSSITSCSLVVREPRYIEKGFLLHHNGSSEYEGHIVVVLMEASFFVLVWHTIEDEIVHVHATINALQIHNVIFTYNNTRKLIKGSFLDIILKLLAQIKKNLLNVSCMHNVLLASNFDKINVNILV
ncbi:hypothetical protein ACJX0J_031033, partial [Zea mays]